MSIIPAASSRKTNILIIFCLFIYIFIIGNNHTTFTGSYIFIGKKTKSSNIRKRTGFINGSMSFSSILYNIKIVFSGYFCNSIHITHFAIDVNRHNRFCPLRNLFFYLIDINIPAVFIRIYENRFCTRITNCKCRSNHCISRKYYFISFSNAKCD